MPEIWKPIARWEGKYEVSSFGRVRSLPRLVKGKHRTGTEFMRTVPERILKPGRLGRYGHLQVVLGSRARSENSSVHRLVAEAFLGPRPEGLDIRHLDGNAGNNQVDNLAYGTRSQNNQDSVRLGKHRLTLEQAAELRAARAGGATLKALAQQYEISVSWVHKIANNGAYICDAI